MTIALRSFATIAAAASGNVVAPIPAGTAENDIILIWTLQRHASSSATNSVDLSGGDAAIFTKLVGYNTGVASEANQEQFAVWIGRRGASYTAPTVAYTTAGQGCYVGSVALSDNDPYTAGNFWESINHDGPIATSPAGGVALTTAGANRFLLQVMGIEDNLAVGAIVQTSATPNSGWAGDNQNSAIGSDGTLTAEYNTLASAGSVVFPTRTVSNEWHALGVALFSAADAGGGITGTLTQTLGSLVLAAAGTLPIVGNSGVTLGVLTLSSTGTLPIVGGLSQTLGALSLTSAGQLVIAGEAAVTLGALTLQATGEEVRLAELAVTLGSLTLSSAANLSIAGESNVTLGTLTVSSAGSLLIQGSATVTLGELTLVSAVDNSTHATLDATLGGLTLNSTAALAIAGQLSQTLGALSLSSTAIYGGRGDLAKTLGALTVAATAAVAIRGSLQKSLGALTLISVADLTTPPGLLNLGELRNPFRLHNEYGRDSLIRDLQQQVKDLNVIITRIEQELISLRTDLDTLLP